VKKFHIKPKNKVYGILSTASWILTTYLLVKKS